MTKKDFNDIGIYYLAYEYKKKITECNVIRSVNPLYLRIVYIKGQFEKGEVLKIKLQKKTWDALEYDKDYMKIKFESNNIFPMDTDVNIHLATIVIRAIFAKDGKYYAQLFLDYGLYKNVSV